MSDNVSVVDQRGCVDSSCEDEKYILDIFSYVQQSEGYGENESLKQLFLYIAKAGGKERSTFIQEEKARLGLRRVHSGKFCWKKTEAACLLVAILEMGDFQAKKTVKREKIDEMRLPEKMTFTMPSCNASSMKVVAKLFNEEEILLETQQLNVSLSMLPQKAPKPGVEHDCISRQPTESSSST